VPLLRCVGCTFITLAILSSSEASAQNASLEVKKNATVRVWSARKSLVAQRGWINELRADTLMLKYPRTDVLADEGWNTVELAARDVDSMQVFVDGNWIPVPMPLDLSLAAQEAAERARVAIQQLPVTRSSAITGTVLDNGKPVEAATVHAERSDKSVARDALTDARGMFRLAPLTAGVYTVTVRRVGYRGAELPGVRVAEAHTLNLSVSLTQAPRQLSTIQVVTSPVQIDATTPELTMRLDREFTELLPSARDASSLIALVPGARKDQLWGGAPGVSNDYQLDGVSMNHPGQGGDFLSLSVDWIEALDIRGLGAGAEHGNFQGGIINAITKTGTNTRRVAMRTNYESAGLTASNLNANEQGVEQAGRREVSGEALGPLAADKLFYFVGGQFVSRDLRSPNLTTTAAHDFQLVREEHVDARGLAKLTWLPALGQRVDVLLGTSTANADHAGINGVDDPTATSRVRQPTTFYELTWNNSISPSNLIDVRLAGFSSRTSTTGYEGPRVPGVQALQLGRMPTFQNAAFDERREPSSIGGSLEWHTTHRVLGVEHQLVLGTDVSRGRWRDYRTRNGGVTWRPYTFNVTNFNALDANTWQTTGSDWGGEIRLDSDVASEAAFLQNYISIGTRLTVTPGLRYGHWTGYVRPQCVSLVTPCYRFDAAHAEGYDPRIGLVWDVTGHNTFVMKAHWGRYHQGMFSLFFDRTQGANVYSNSRFYYAAPKLTSPRISYTPAQRDAPGSGFSPFFDETILDESGRVENYRQPYVDQSVLGFEKSFGTSLKAEVLYTHRRNGDIVGLIDRNRATNYSPVYNTSVDQRLVNGRVLDAKGNRLVLPVLYVSNKDLYDVLHSCGDNHTSACGGKIAGYAASDILPWNPDVVLTTVPQAARHYDQFTTMIRAYRPIWRGEGSVTMARLRGNVPGVTGYGTTGSRFSAGPFVRPNEAINFEGVLPDALELEGKVWLTMRLPHSLQGGVLYTHTLGERFTPSFEFNGRYVYTDSLRVILPGDLFKRILGQTVLVEPRGSRQYASRDVVDLHLEWRLPRRATVAFDVFNVFGSDALTLINTNIGDQDPADLTSVFGAARLRVSPRTLRVGLRID
jgi:hypothetical protein